jgi:hypothetical protein
LADYSPARKKKGETNAFRPGAPALDRPGDGTFFQFIEALAASGITGGCVGGNFCPDAPMTRGRMAVFLAKALGLHFPH